MRCTSNKSETYPNPFFHLYRPALVLIYALCGKDWRAFWLWVWARLHSGEQNKRMGVTIQTSCAERSMCVPNSLLHPALTPFYSLLPSVSISLSSCPPLFSDRKSVSIGARKSRATGHATSRCVTVHLNPRGTRDRERKTWKTERERERCICIAPSVPCCSNKHKSNAGKPSTCINIYLRFESEPKSLSQSYDA